MHLTDEHFEVCIRFTTEIKRVVKDCLIEFIPANEWFSYRKLLSNM